MRLSLWKTTSVRGVQTEQRRKQSEEREENWPRKQAKKLRRKGEGTKTKRRRFIFNFSPFLKLFLKFYFSFFFLFIYSYFFQYISLLFYKMLIIIWIFYMGIKFRDFFTISKSANFQDPQKPVRYIKIRWIGSSNYIDRYETHYSIRE